MLNEFGTTPPNDTRECANMLVHFRFCSENVIFGEYDLRRSLRRIGVKDVEIMLADLVLAGILTPHDRSGGSQWYRFNQYP